MRKAKIKVSMVSQSSVWPDLDMRTCLVILHTSRPRNHDQLQQADPKTVRNRAQEIAALLADVEKIRTERRKAKANRSKYQGTGNDGLSFSSGSGGRYGGFGSETVGGARVGSGGFTEGDGQSGYNSSSAKRSASVILTCTNRRSRLSTPRIHFPRRSCSPTRIIRRI